MTREREALEALDRIDHGARPADLESRTLDFKEDSSRSINDTIKDAVDAAICFANSDGGVVVHGVRDRAEGSDAFRGTALDPERLKERVYKLTVPPLLVDARVERRHDKDLVLVFVPRSPEIHADTKGRVVHRMGTECLPMPPQVLARVRDERRGVDWSASESPVPLTDVVVEAVTQARNLLGASRDASNRSLARLPVEGLLRELGLLTDTDKLNRAGEILFTSQGGVADVAAAYQYRETQGGEPRSIERLSGPLLLVLRRTLEYIQARTNVTLLTLPDGQQVQIEDFPALAVREAVANAVLHRDYHLPDQAVSIVHSPSVLAVTSPGPLVSGITPENILTHASRPRNPTLMRAARILGLAEEIGRGVDRMYREMLRAGKDVPKIESTHDEVGVLLVGGAPNKQIARHVARLPEAEREDTDTLLVLHRLSGVRTVTALDLVPVLQRTEHEIEQTLRRLATDDVGILEPTRATHRRAHPHYRLRSGVLKALGTAVGYRRRTVDDIDRKVIAHVREYGKITNRTMQNLLDVSMNRARDLLSDLISREVLVKTSTHQRGPGVEYGRGPKFPRKKAKKKAKKKTAKKKKAKKKKAKQKTAKKKTAKKKKAKKKTAKKKKAKKKKAKKKKAKKKKAKKGR